MNKNEWIAAAAEHGFKAFEIYTASETGRSISWYEGALDTFTTSRTKAVTLRGLYGNGRMVQVSSEAPDSLDMQEVLERMAEQAQLITSEDESFIREPKETEEEQSGLHFIPADTEEIKALLADLEQRIRAFDPRIVQVINMAWEDSSEGKEIFNSNGIDISEASEGQYLVAGVAVSDGKDVKTGYHAEVIEDLTAFDREKFVKKLCDDTLSQLGGSSIPSAAMPVIIEKDAMTSLFSVLTDMFSGDNIGKGISPLTGRLGEAVFSDKITVTDDPREPKLLAFSNYDDEGCPTSRKTLVKDGVFTAMLHDTKSAARMGAESTGNGFGGVRPRGCSIAPGDKTLEELMADMGEGLLITSLAGLHAGVNHVTTDFSLQCSGYLVKGGAKDRAVTLITAAGNFLDLMKNVVSVGSDLEWSYRSIAAPSIAFSNLAISGE